MEVSLEPPLLHVDRVRKYFSLRVSPFSSVPQTLKAVDGVSFTIRDGESVALVGESGCGKTTLARLILHLETPTAGTVYFQGRETKGLKGRDLHAYRRAVQAVFQDPTSSLNPRMRVKSIIQEPMIGLDFAKSRSDAVLGGLLGKVGLETQHLRSFPHELSVGQRQRVAIARALAPSPRAIVLDEPVSSLDLSIRAQIMNLLKDLRENNHLTYLLIAHDFATVRYMCTRVLVLYMGQIVEEAEDDLLFSNPHHPYSQALLAASKPIGAVDKNLEVVLAGEVPSPIAPPSGCRFHTRCPFAFDRCKVEQPRMVTVARGHRVACHLYDELDKREQASSGAQ